MYDVPLTPTAILFPAVPAGVNQRGWWFSTPAGGLCNGTSTASSDERGRGCTWSRDPLVRLIWTDDLRAAGFDFSHVECNEWVCSTAAVKRATAMIAANAEALRRAVNALPLAPS
jgi:hypothetical protein